MQALPAGSNAPAFEIEFKSVSVARGGRPVLSSVDLGVPKGETVALVGRSGAGKSTILKLVNRLLAPDAGPIRVVGASDRRSGTRTICAGTSATCSRRSRSFHT